MSPQEKTRGNVLSHTEKEKGGQKMELVVMGSEVPCVTEMSSWAGSHWEEPRMVTTMPHLPFLGHGDRARLSSRGLGAAI